MNINNNISANSSVIPAKAGIQYAQSPFSKEQRRLFLQSPIKPLTIPEASNDDEILTLDELKKLDKTDTDTVSKLDKTAYTNKISSAANQIKTSLRITNLPPNIQTQLTLIQSQVETEVAVNQTHVDIINRAIGQIDNFLKAPSTMLNQSLFLTEESGNKSIDRAALVKFLTTQIDKNSKSPSISTILLAQFPEGSLVNESEWNILQKSVKAINNTNSKPQSIEPQWVENIFDTEGNPPKKIDSQQEVESLVAQIRLSESEIQQSKAEKNLDGKVDDIMKSTSLSGMLANLLGKDLVTKLLKSNGIVGKLAKMFFSVEAIENSTAANDTFKKEFLESEKSKKYSKLFSQNHDFFRGELSKQKTANPQIEPYQSLFSKLKTYIKLDGKYTKPSEAMVTDLVSRFGANMKNNATERVKPLTNEGKIKLQSISIKTKLPSDARAIAEFYAPKVRLKFDIGMAKSFFSKEDGTKKTKEEVKKESNSTSTENKIGKATQMLAKYAKSDPYSAQKPAMIPQGVEAKVQGTTVQLIWSENTASITDQLKQAFKAFTGKESKK
ncbi:hypothetical protein HON22_03410 [Candidatus Peregrinibacteria bacterium]|jgi:hypothetical protein|nr:hypothetical protein [Candidatus Peregrinibacteria bacterium]